MFSLIRASREAAKARLAYIETKLHESQLSVQYYQRQLEDSQKYLREANESVGRIRVEMRDHKIPFYVTEQGSSQYMYKFLMFC